MSLERPEFTFVRKPDEELAKKTSAAMMQRRSERVRLSGERLMTDEEVTFLIYAIEMFVPIQLSSLGLDESTFSTAIRNVHFIDRSQTEYEASSEDNCSLGGYRSITGDVIVYVESQEQRSKIHHYATILHELLHSAAQQKYEIQAHNNDGKTTNHLYSYRSGYEVENPDAPSPRLQAFNEGLTELMTWIIMKERLENPEVRETLGLTEEEVRAQIDQSQWSCYLDAQLLVLLLANGVSKATGKDALNTFQRGYFTGEMMHLRAIEKTFGRGSLEMVEAMVSNPEDGEQSKRNQKILQYFRPDTSPEERQQLFVAVLGKSTIRRDERKTASIKA